MPGHRMAPAHEHVIARRVSMQKAQRLVIYSHATHTYVLFCGVCAYARSFVSRKTPGRALTRNCTTQLASSLLLLISAPGYLILTQKFRSYPAWLPSPSPIANIWQPKPSQVTKVWNKITSHLSCKFNISPLLPTEMRSTSSVNMRSRQYFIALQHRWSWDLFFRL